MVSFDKSGHILYWIRLRIRPRLHINVFVSLYARQLHFLNSVDLKTAHVDWAKGWCTVHTESCALKEMNCPLVNGCTEISSIKPITSHLEGQFPHAICWCQPHTVRYTTRIIPWKSHAFSSDFHARLYRYFIVYSYTRCYESFTVHRVLCAWKLW